MRQALSGAVPVVADSMRTTGPMWGTTYAGAVFAMVPRQFWENKPRGPGSIYAQTFLGEPEEGTAIPIGDVAEAFWNFHLPGVIVLFAVYGMLLRRVYELYAENPDNGLVVAFFLLFATQFGVSTDQLVTFQQTLLTLTIILIILLVAYPGAFGRKPRRPHRPNVLQQTTV